MNSDQLHDVAMRLSWWHSIDLGRGAITPGHKSAALLKSEADAVFEGLELQGATVLDVGAWDGYFSFEAKKRGASRVLAADQFVWLDSKLYAKRNFDIARHLLKLDVEDLVIDIPDLTVERVGEFDYVLFLGVFYHLIDPISAVKNLAKIAKKAVIIESHLDMFESPFPAMRFYPGSECNNDPTNWWGPNPVLMLELLRSVGFEYVTAQPHPIVGPTRGIFHASRDAPQMKTHDPYSYLREFSSAYKLESKATLTDFLSGGRPKRKGRTRSFVSFYFYNSAKFVERSYQLILGRPPTELEAESLHEQLRNRSLSKSQAMVGLRFSNEGRAAEKNGLCKVGGLKILRIFVSKKKT